MAGDAFDFSDVFMDIENRIDSFMHDGSTKQVLQGMLSESADENVYAKYDSPAATPYVRRYTMTQPGNYEIQEGRLSLTAINTAVGIDGGELNDMIEGGYGYTWENSYMFRHPIARPFMEKGVNRFVDDYLMPTIHELIFND